MSRVDGDVPGRRKRTWSMADCNSEVGLDRPVDVPRLKARHAPLGSPRRAGQTNPKAAMQEK